MPQKMPSVSIDDRQSETSYANSVRINAGAEELMVEFGVVCSMIKGEDNPVSKTVMQLNNRIAMNYYTAKRLVISLGDHLRKYEEEFGEIELNPEKRRISKK